MSLPNTFEKMLAHKGTTLSERDLLLAAHLVLSMAENAPEGNVKQLLLATADAFGNQAELLRVKTPERVV